MFLNSYIPVVMKVYARIGMGELVLRTSTGAVPRNQFSADGMPTEPERFLGWLETDFCNKLLNGEVEMGSKDSKRSYLVGCAFLKGLAAVLAIDAPLSASAEELKRGIKILFAKWQTKEAIESILQSLQSPDDLCKVFQQFKIYPLGATGKLWARRCGAKAEKPPKNFAKLLEALYTAYPYFYVYVDKAEK
jgi:hypothetical protein